MALTHDDYTVVWICALPLEMAVARAMLDKTHVPLPKRATDPNAYIYGEIKGHCIVIACLPKGIYGKGSARSVVAHTKSSFPNIRLGLMVGIGGGVPGASNDIRLGDVIVAQPTGQYSGVIQYDFGKAVQGGQLELTGSLNKPPQFILTHISSQEATQMVRRDGKISEILHDVLSQNSDMRDQFSPPDIRTDYLFPSSYHHVDKSKSCEMCDQGKLVSRPERETRTPRIHYGLIASGDQVIKDSETRDRLAQKHGIICFEMEAAGIVDEIPTLVIRGICDYCDSHKQKEWQKYAALTAAAYTKSLLYSLPTTTSTPTSPARLRHWVVPLARNSRFVGRQDIISQLEECLSAHDGPRKIAVTGLGGAGKTQVVLELAYRIRQHDEGCSVFWVPCTSSAVIEQAYLEIAQTVGLEGLEPAQVKEQVKTYLSSKRAGRWLMILDNVDDPNIWFSRNEVGLRLGDYLPRNEQGRILFTTRNRKLAVDLSERHIFPMPDLDKETALSMLQKLTSEKELLRDPIGANALLEQLAFLPLAIAQASAYIAKNGLDLSEYLELLQDQESEVVELLSEEFTDQGRYEEIQNPVITTWLISFKQIQHENQLAADILFFMACCNPRNIPTSLLPLPTSKKRQIDALGVLDAYSFTNRQDKDINLHRLVHLATRNYLRKNGQFRDCISRAADHMQNVFPDCDYTNRKQWREYIPHALFLFSQAEFTDQRNKYIDLMDRAAHCLSSDGRWYEAEVLYLSVWNIEEERSGPEHPDTLGSMADLASIYLSQGRWKEAEKLSLQVMEKRKIHLGPDHLDTLSSMTSLASVYQDQGRWKEAEKLALEVIEKRKIFLGPDHLDTLNSMASLAAIYREQRRWKKAEKLGLQVMEKRKIALGTDHLDTLSSMEILASAYLGQGRWEEAEELEMQAIDITREVLGAEHPDTLTSMANLAEIYSSQYRWAEAEKLEIQVRDLSKKILGPEHPDTLISMSNLACTWKSESRSKLPDALKLMEECLALRIKVIGPEHPDTISTANAVENWKQELEQNIRSREESLTLRQIEPSQVS
ncbi:hypothetical protein N7488_000663 [Penicillium malachiteum]|nr:hypothetical protein N7488_000663 [Penicillium malachiteum]